MFLARPDQLIVYYVYNSSLTLGAENKEFPTFSDSEIFFSTFKNFFNVRKSREFLIFSSDVFEKPILIYDIKLFYLYALNEEV